MVYGIHSIHEDCVYSIDFMQIDFCLGALSEEVQQLLFNSFDFMKCCEFGSLNCSSGSKALAKYTVHWWQFSHFHIEIWPKSIFRDIAVPRDEDDDRSVVVSEKQWFLRVKFNPNKCTDNPAPARVFRFLKESGLSKNTILFN